MADVEEEEDFETDEHGIYREKTEDYSGSENGLMVDEDGIWQDDDDVDSFHRGGNDSGFCTAEQKSSSSFNNRMLQDGVDGGEQTIPGRHKVKENEEQMAERDDEEEEEEEEEELGRHQGHLAEEHSYNITELEASRSASVHGSQISYHPDMDDVNSDSRYPELGNGYFTSESELSKREKGDAGHHGDSEYMAYYREEEEDPDYTTNDEESPSERERFSERDHRSSAGSARGNVERHPNISDQRLSNSQSHRHHRENSTADPTIGINRMATRGLQHEERFLSSGHNTETAEPLKGNGEKPQGRIRPVRQDRTKDASHVRQMQDEVSMSQETEHSLAEFEQLEATLDEVSSSGSEDLIGIYLRETEQWELKDETVPQSEDNRHSSTSQNNGNNDNRSNGKVQDIPKRKRSQDSHGSSRTDERLSRPPSGSRSERTSGKVTNDALKLPDSRNPRSRTSEKNELGRPQETRNLLQKTSEVLTKLNQESSDHSYHDNKPAASQHSQIPILRSRSASLTRPGRQWSRSRGASPSPSPSHSKGGSLSSPHPPPPQQQESEPNISKKDPDSVVSDRWFSSRRQSSERKTGGSEHYSPDVHAGRIDSLRSHDNRSPASSSRHTPSATSQHQVRTSSVESSRSGFPSEERKDVNRVASQTLKDSEDESGTHRTSQNYPAQLSSAVSSRRGKKSSESSVNQNDAISTSLTNINRHQYLTPPQAKSSVPHLKKKRSNSVGGLNRFPQPLRAMPGFMKSSVPDAIGAISRRMADAEHGAGVDFKEMYQFESQQHRMTVETYQELQAGYLHLLKENAEIKNTVDSMRLGAEVRLIPAATSAPVSVETGTMPSARRANVFTLSKMSTPSLSIIRRDANVAEAGTVTGPQQATLSEISQDGGVHHVRSIQTPRFQRQMEGVTAPSPASLATKTLADAVAETSISPPAEDVFSLSGRIKATENRIKEFHRRSDEDSIEERIKFLQRIRDDYAELEDEFDNDFVQEDGIYSSASRSKRNEIESQLVQLHLTIGQMEDEEAAMNSNDARHAVNGDLDVQNRESLFPAAESVNDDGWNAGIYSGSETQSFRHNRGSVVSIAGNCDTDEQLQGDFNMTYAELMDRYRRLKQMKSSSQRDDDITMTLTTLKKVYRQIPDHRKPALPAELENQYNPAKGSFVDSNSEQEARKQNGLNGFASQQEFSTSAEASSVMNDSDLSSGSKSADSVKRFLSSERQSKKQSSASQSNDSGSSQTSLRQNRMPPTAQGTVTSRSRDNSAPSERPRHHGSRRLPKSAAKSQSQSDSLQDDFFRNGQHKLSGGKRSTHRKPPLPSDLQIKSATKVPGSQRKTEQKMIRTSAHTPPGQSYSDTESDGTDDTVEEILKQKQKLGRDQFDNTDGIPQPQAKDENRRAALVGSSGGELDSTASVTEDEMGLHAAKRSDKREDSAESAHLQKFTEAQQRQMPQPIPLHPTTTVNPSVTFYVPSLQRLQNPYLHSIHQPGTLQQLSLQQPDLHQVYVPTGTVPNGAVPAGINPANMVTGNQGVHGNYFVRNGYALQPPDPMRFLENGYGQSTSMTHPGTHYNTYHRVNPDNVTDYLNTDRNRHQVTRDGQRIGTEDRRRLYPTDRYEKSSHRHRTSRRRHGPRSVDDAPLPSVYFEPTAPYETYPQFFLNGLPSQREAFVPHEVRPLEAGAFPSQHADPYSFVSANNAYGNGVGVGTGVGSGGLPTIYQSLKIASRGVQNVPSMSTTGVQYMVDNGPSYAGSPGRNTQHGNQTGQAGRTGQSTTDQPVVVTGSSCPLCGRTDYHSHTDSNLQVHNRLGHVPAGSNAQVGVVPGLPQGAQTLVQLPNGQMGLAFVGSPSSTVGLPYTASSSALPSTQAGSFQAIPIQNQGSPSNVTSSPSRIRYYVREYDGQGTVDDEGTGSRHPKQPKSRSRSSKHHLSTYNDDDDDDGDDVDWALLRAVSTAKSLRKRSEDMAESLHNELLLAFKDSTILQSF